MNWLTFIPVAILSFVDICMTLWTINFMKNNKELISERRKELEHNPANCETSFIPRLLMELKAPPIVFFIWSIGILFVVNLIVPNEVAKSLMLFMFGAYMVIIQIHLSNISDFLRLKKEKDGISKKTN